MSKAPAASNRASIPKAKDPEPARKSYNHPCLIAQTLDVLGDRWTLLILRDLISGLHRYTDILESCTGMSPNVLADRLKRLEAEGMLERRYYRELPPRVEYSLTEKGWSVRPILLSLIEWGQENIGAFPLESVGGAVSTEFAMRVVPAFSFHPERAEGLDASMVIEISDCSDCNSWTFEIREGHIYPRRQAGIDADVHLRTTTDGFFRFLSGDAPPEECGELRGVASTARAIQSCFLLA